MPAAVLPLVVTATTASVFRSPLVCTRRLVLPAGSLTFTQSPLPALFERSPAVRTKGSAVATMAVAAVSSVAIAAAVDADGVDTTPGEREGAGRARVVPRDGVKGRGLRRDEGEGAGRPALRARAGDEVGPLRVAQKQQRRGRGGARGGDAEVENGLRRRRGRERVDVRVVRRRRVSGDGRPRGQRRGSDGCDRDRLGRREVRRSWSRRPARSPDRTRPHPQARPRRW